MVICFEQFKMQYITDGSLSPVNGDGNLNSFIVDQLEDNSATPDFLTDLFLTPEEGVVHLIFLDSGRLFDEGKVILYS